MYSRTEPGNERELRQVDWEERMCGPDDDKFERMDRLVDPGYEPPENDDNFYLPPKGEDMVLRDEEMDEYGFMDDEFDEFRVLMISATKRQKKIVKWLADSPLAEPVKGGSRADFLVREGSPVRMQDGPMVELLSWLESEGFDENIMVSDYTVSVGPDRRGPGEVMVFRKKQVLKAPFSLADSPAEFPEDEEERNVDFSDDDIPF